MSTKVISMGIGWVTGGGRCGPRVLEALLMFEGKLEAIDSAAQDRQVQGSINKHFHIQRALTYVL